MDNEQTEQPDRRWKSMILWWERFIKNEDLSLERKKGVFNVLCSELTYTRNSSGDEIANVNFLTDDIVHALQNTTDSCINSATDLRGYVLEHRFTKFSEITQCNGHYAVQVHSRSPILVPIESSYDFLLVINLPPILHRFQLTADYRSNSR